MIKKKNMFCEPQKSERYNTLSEATQKCIQDLDCGMFFDDGGIGSHFVPCSWTAKMEKSNDGSVLYLRGKVKYMQVVVVSKYRVTIA